MKINTLQLINFRNYDHTALSFDHMVNIFYGKNGQGKNAGRFVIYSSLL